jgi:hypothetical protein
LKVSITPLDISAIVFVPSIRRSQLGIRCNRHYPRFAFAHLALCAAAIFLRLAAVTVRFEPLPSAAKAPSMRCASLCTRSRSAFNCSITADMFAIGE